MSDEITKEGEERKTTVRCSSCNGCTLKAEIS